MQCSYAVNDIKAGPVTSLTSSPYMCYKSDELGSFINMYWIHVTLFTELPLLCVGYLL